MRSGPSAKANAIERLFERVDRELRAAGCLAISGQLPLGPFVEEAVPGVQDLIPKNVVEGWAPALRPIRPRHGALESGERDTAGDTTAVAFLRQPANRSSTSTN